LAYKGSFPGFGRMLPGKGSDKTGNKDSVQEEINRVPGAEPSSKLDPWWWLVVAVIVLLILMMVLSPTPYWNIFRFVGDGIWITIQLTIYAFILTLIIGMVGGIGRIAGNPVIKFISTIYVEIVRGIPLLVQLIWWYFAAPVIIKSIGEWLNWAPLENFRANAMIFAVVGLAVCYGAYMAEIFRAGIQSIPKGQMEAARSLGMSYFQAMKHIIIPQAFRVVLPPVGNEFIMLIKDTSLVSAVAMADLTRRGREYMSAHFNPIQTWTMIALLYLVLTLLSARLIAWLESRRKY
jgi:polar amino acid transport system permease protein